MADGTFQAPLNTAIPVPTGALLVGDLNGDGKPDVLTGSGLSYLGKGDGTFVAGVPSGAPAPGPFDMLADFNGDGKLDLFTIGAGIQLGNGNGTFQALLPFPTGALTGFVVGDFDGDGKLDVAGFGGTPTNPELQVLFGNGDGTFRAGPVESEPSGTLALTYGPAVDLNKDGKADLTFGSSSAFEVLLSNGDGTFIVGKRYSTANQYNQFGVAASNIVAADFNRDGKLDLAAFNTLLPGNGDGTLQGDEIIPGLSGSDVTGDLNKDGHPDLARVGGGSGSNENLEIWLNDGKANFTLAHTYQIPLSTQNSFVVLTGAVDLNGDGNLDLVGYIDGYSSWTVIVLLGNGDGSFGTPIVSSGAAPARFVTGFTLADIRGDGKPDLMVVVANMGVDGRFLVLLNNGDGTFAAPVEYFAGIPDSNVVAADFNKDGKLDAIVGTDGNGLAVLLGNGDGTFQPTTYLTNTACALACGSTTSLAAFDFNGDGNEDLVVATRSGMQVLLGKGDGSFTALPATGTTIGLLQIADSTVMVR
jgi:FG-GAP-like repeat/FG-GAP repeat